jgi:hypothetical protein
MTLPLGLSKPWVVIATTPGMIGAEQSRGADRHSTIPARYANPTGPTKRASHLWPTRSRAERRSP